MPLLHASMDAAGGLDFCAVAQLVALQVDAPIALVAIVDADRRLTHSAFGLPDSDRMIRDLDLREHMVPEPDRLTVVPDATLDPRLAGLAAVTGEPGIRFYAVAPLKDADGRSLGALSVLDTKPRTLNELASGRLSILAEVVSANIAIQRVNAGLKASEERYRYALELGPQVAWHASEAGRIEQISPRWHELIGLGEQEGDGTKPARRSGTGTETGAGARLASDRRGRPADRRGRIADRRERGLDRPERVADWMDRIHPDEHVATTSIWAECLRRGEALDVECRLLAVGGLYRWFRVRASMKRHDADGSWHWYGTIEDVDDRRLSDIALRASEQRLRFALEVGRLGAWEFHIASRRLDASDLCAANFGLASGKLLRSYDTLLDAVHPGDKKRQCLAVEHALVSGHVLDVEYRNLWPDGSVHWVRDTGRAIYDEDGSARCIIGLSIDVTERRRLEDERMQAEARLAHLANHDALTDLANRRLLNARMTQALGRSSVTARTALICIDLDQFKALNDALGHEEGDKLLRHAAARLRDCVGPGDLVARYGGDEFAVLRSHAGDRAEVDRLARTLLRSLSEPLDLDGKSIVLGGSIGIALSPDDATDPVQLRRNADTALYRAKASGRGTHQFFSREMDAGAQRREALKIGLQNALARDELVLLYQPMVAIGTNRVQGLEALMRWRHPTRGVVSPDEFISVAEESGWITRFGRWALHEACLAAREWPDDVTVAVNLSMVQFSIGDLYADVADALAHAGIAPSRLELEVTETLLLHETDANTAVLLALRALGVRIVLDDFGSGYSSLAYLRRFTFDKIKIDRSLVRGLPDGGGGDAIVQAIAGLGRIFRIAITAEGVETAEQLDFVRREGVAEAQGYLFSYPVAACDVAGLLGYDLIERGRLRGIVS